MKDSTSRPPSKLPSKVISIILLMLATMCLVICFLLMLTLHESFVLEYSSRPHYKLKEQSHFITLEINKLLGEAASCQENQNIECYNELEKKALLLQKKISTYEAIIANEKEMISSVGVTTYDQVSATLRHFKSSQNITILLSELSQLLGVILVDSYYLNNTNNNALEQYKNEKISVAILFLLASGVMYLIAFIGVYVVQRKHYAKRQYYAEILTALSRNITQWIPSHLNHLVEDKKLIKQERQIYSRILKEMQKISVLQKDKDSSFALYSMIGYEIRNISNVIKGSTHLLIEADENVDKLLAHELVMSAEMLESMAENFNHFFMVHHQQSENVINPYELFYNLAATITSKIHHQQKEIESYIDLTLPYQTSGNMIEIFLTLLLQCSSAIKTHAESHVIFLLHKKSSSSLENMTLSFEIIFTPDLTHTVDDIQNLAWREKEQQHQYHPLSLGKINAQEQNEKSNWLEAGAYKKLQIEVDVKPSQFYQKNYELKNKHILICGSSLIQTDILRRIFLHYGANVVVTASANEVFNTLKSSKHFDAIMITDNVRGIDLSSFCKTLSSHIKKSSPNTRLILSLSKAHLNQNAHHHVDHVLFRPFNMTAFITEMQHMIQTENETKGELEKHIMIVEDDKMQQFILKNMIDIPNANFHLAASGEEAISLFKEQSYDIIFMDCLMEGMGGMEATQQIRAYEKEHQKKPITIIGATGLQSADEHRQCVNSGMDAVTVKPYKREKIDDVIRTYIAMQTTS